MEIKLLKTFLKVWPSFHVQEEEKSRCESIFSKEQQTDLLVERHRIKIPTLGWVRLKEYGYIPSNVKVTSCTVSQKADRYYVSVLCEVDTNK